MGKGHVAKSLPSGTTEEKTINLQAFARVLDPDHDRRGWTRDSVPTRETWEVLGLAEMAQQLHS